MSDLYKLYRLNQQTLTVDVTDSTGGAITGATVTAKLQNAAGVDVPGGGPWTLTADASSPPRAGYYVTTIADFSVADGFYTLVIDSSGGGHWIGTIQVAERPW